MRAATNAFSKQEAAPVPVASPQCIIVSEPLAFPGGHSFLPDNSDVLPRTLGRGEDDLTSLCHRLTIDQQIAVPVHRRLVLLRCPLLFLRHFGWGGRVLDVVVTLVFHFRWLTLCEVRLERQSRRAARGGYSGNSRRRGRLHVFLDLGTIVWRTTIRLEVQVGRGVFSG